MEKELATHSTCWENHEAWRARVLGGHKSWTWLTNWTTTTKAGLQKGTVWVRARELLLHCRVFEKEGVEVRFLPFFIHLPFSLDHPAKKLISLNYSLLIHKVILDQMTSPLTQSSHRWYKFLNFPPIFKLYFHCCLTAHPEELLG